MSHILTFYRMMFRCTFSAHWQYFQCLSCGLRCLHTESTLSPYLFFFLLLIWASQVFHFLLHHNFSIPILYPIAHIWALQLIHFHFLFHHCIIISPYPCFFLLLMGLTGFSINMLETLNSSNPIHTLKSTKCFLDTLVALHFSPTVSGSVVVSN